MGWIMVREVVITAVNGGKILRWTARIEFWGVLYGWILVDEIDVVVCLKTIFFFFFLIIEFVGLRL